MMIVQEQQQQDARQRSHGRGRGAPAAGRPTSQTSRLQEGGLEAVEATPP